MINYLATLFTRVTTLHVNNLLITLLLLYFYCFRKLNTIFAMTNENAIDFWDKSFIQLKEILQPDIFKKWISVIAFKSYEEGTFYLTVPSDLYTTWLRDNYLPLIKQTISYVSGENCDISLSVDSARERPKDNTLSFSLKEMSNQKKRKKEHNLEKKLHQANLNKKFSFSSFVIGPSNNFSHACALAVAQKPAHTYNPLFIYSPSGLGKTHLIQAIGNEIVRTEPHKKVLYIPCEKFTNEYIDALRNGKLTRFRKKYRSINVLLMDDIHFLVGKERMQEEFFHTFNSLFNDHKQIVITCDRPARELPGLTPRLISRFEWGILTELNKPDLETRIAILRNKCDDLTINIPDHMLNFIAEHISHDIRRLEGALTKIASYLSLYGKEIDIATVQNLLRDSLDHEPKNNISIGLIQQIVAKNYNLRVADITSKRRPAHIAWPRQVAMFLCRDITEQSLPMIGREFDRNHATVLHAYNRVKEKMDADFECRNQIQALKTNISKA